MFKIIGGDGREYGPVSADQVRQWIVEHRANAQTLVQEEASADWRPLGEWAEFAEPLRAAWSEPGVADLEPSESDPGPGVEPAGVWVERRLSVTDCLSRGWWLLGRHFGLIAGATFLVWVVQTAASFGGCLGGLIVLVLSGALHGGLMLVYMRLIRGEPVSVRDTFAGFGPQFFPLMLVWIVSTVVSQLGLLFCIVPGLVLKVIWVFGLVLVADRGLAFWPALEESRQRVLPCIFRVTALLLVAYLPLIVFALYSGWQVSAHMFDTLGPLGTWRWDDLQSKMRDLTEYAARLALYEQVVLLLNLPFAYAALMYAYEDLFGRRRPTSD